jgi:chromosome segregation ATPase
MSKRKVEKNEVIKVSKEILKRMEDFQDSVQKLSDLQGGIEELDEKLADQERINKYKLDGLNSEFKENKIKAVNNAAAELDKVLVTKEELAELKNDLAKLKAEGAVASANQSKKLEDSYKEKLGQELNIQKLKHECEIASLKAEVETHKKECENIKANLARMSEELNSQKELTANIANMNRPIASSGGNGGK